MYYCEMLNHQPLVLRHYLTFSPANSLHVFFQARGSGEADQ